MNPIFWFLGSAAFISGASLRMFDTLLPNLAEDFAVEPTVASIVVTAFTLAYGLFQVVHGAAGIIPSHSRGSAITHPMRIARRRSGASWDSASRVRSWGRRSAEHSRSGSGGARCST